MRSIRRASARTCLPSILASGFNAQHSQSSGIESSVRIFPGSGKQEIWPGFSLCDPASLIVNRIAFENDFEVVLKGAPNPALSPILDGERECDETINILGKTLAQLISQKMLLQSAEENLLTLHPAHECSIRIGARIEVWDGGSSIGREHVGRRECSSKLLQHRFQIIWSCRPFWHYSELLKDEAGCELNPVLLCFQLLTHREAFQLHVDAEKPLDLVRNCRAALRDYNKHLIVWASCYDKKIALGGTSGYRRRREVKTMFGTGRVFQSSVIPSDRSVRDYWVVIRVTQVDIEGLINMFAGRTPEDCHETSIAVIFMLIAASSISLNGAQGF